ncbi:MAG: hypothetical protein A2V66_16280 [Ignavibacteria bacterium RBG_13_36_8]|nr:MAG: hypothetical protein A2V66_16280 [Ignavibacteria bacterium RBG_13_36_8]
MVGDFIILNNKEANILSRAIKFFTRSKFTHTAIGMGKVLGEEATLGAELLISVLPLKRWTEDSEVEVIIYRPVKIPSKIKREIVKEMYEHFVGTEYGYFQLLWFIWRWIAEGLGFDVRKRGNWFPEGTICSELNFYYLERLAKYYNDNDLTVRLQEWNGNNFTPRDAYTVINEFKGTLFKEVKG